MNSVLLCDRCRDSYRKAFKMGTKWLTIGPTGSPTESVVIASGSSIQTKELPSD